MALYESVFEYYEQQHQHTLKWLKQCMVHAEPEAVHQLRLCIKKLKAFHLLAMQLDLNENKDYKVLSRLVKKVFRLAGQLRDTQVQIQMLNVFEQENNRKFPEFAKWLYRYEKKQVAELCGSQSRKSVQSASIIINKGNSLDASHIEDAAILKGAYQVTGGLFHKIGQLVTGNISDENLHDIRKYTKQLRYILNIFQSNYPDFHFHEITSASLREIETYVGHWHDCLIRQARLEQFVAGKKPGTKSMLVYERLTDSFNLELEKAYEEACILVKHKVLD